MPLQRHSYCPTVLILKPGQLLHINKNRLHMFRKMTFESISTVDCHYQLRRQMIAELKEMAPDLKTAPLCISIAWDW